MITLERRPRATRTERHHVLDVPEQRLALESVSSDRSAETTTSVRSSQSAARASTRHAQRRAQARLCETTRTRAGRTSEEERARPTHPPNGAMEKPQTSSCRNGPRRLGEAQGPACRTIRTTSWTRRKSRGWWVGGDYFQQASARRRGSRRVEQQTNSERVEN